MTRAVWSIAPAVREAIIRHARRESPRECCGFLVGVPKGILYALPMPNVAARATRYRIDNRAHIDIRRVLRRFVPALSVVGVYHSHPAGPAQPSARDVDEAMYPDWAYLIVGLEHRPPRVRGFRIRRGRVDGLRLRWRRAAEVRYSVP
jgi:proteasome lid subunit RPN8/RPN11